ncbi:MAG: asparagine--tRNA ligase [Actinobacteria bacterium]|nr:asparagine--tRNA ligase [Actinomycetota bacterium]MBU1494240.1 asparagine--tRNA ligase [Actinomycetota bacterium]
MDRQLIKHVFGRTDFGSAVTVAGWVRTRRDSKGGFSFIDLNDGSSFSSIQVIAPGELANYQSDVLRLTIGSSIAVTGELVESPGEGQAVEIRAAEITVYGFADPETYPLQKKRTSLERLREIAHLRPRTNTIGAVARVRNALAFATHRFYQERDFLYLHTPMITTSDAEGSGEMFQVTTLDPASPPRDLDGNVDYTQDFFGRQAFLTVSGQLEAEAYALALDRVYTFGPTFRAENSNTRRHLAEFWMIEPEAAFFDLDDNARLAEDYLKYMVRYLLETCEEDIAFFDKWIDDSVLATLTAVVDRPFERITYGEAIDILGKADAGFEFPTTWGSDLQSEHEVYLAEQAFDRPVIVTDYPSDIKAFYMRRNDDGTVAAMDVLVPRVGELIGGSQREERLDVLAASIDRHGLDADLYWWYLDLRRFGTAPHSGFGLGFARMVAFATGMQNVRDVVPFPRTPRNAEF